MKKWFLVCFSWSLFGALPPLVQQGRELEALLAHSSFYESLGSAETLEQIIRTEKGYLILTGHYAMQVEIIYGSSRGQIGPTPFELKFYPPIALSTEE